MNKKLFLLNAILIGVATFITITFAQQFYINYIEDIDCVPLFRLFRSYLFWIPVSIPFIVFISNKFINLLTDNKNVKQILYDSLMTKGKEFKLDKI